MVLRLISLVWMLVAGPAAGDGLLEELNAARRAAGRPAVELQPAVGDAAQARAEAAARRGAAKGDMGSLVGTSQRLERGGYKAHTWTESTLITSARPTLRQFCRLRPKWCDDAASGEFEHVGIGLAKRGREHVATIVLALPRRTVALARAAPLGDLPAVRRAVLEAVNAARRERRLAPLTAAPLLDAVAQGHADDMLRRGYYDHVSPDGSTPSVRVRAAGYRGARMTAENIAKGYFEPEETVRQWLRSSGHRRNILDARAEELGVGVAVGEVDGGVEVLWVQVFAGR